MENQDLLSDFLGNVAEKIKTAKEHKSIMEAVYASASATETVTEQGDPFAHFLQKVGNTIASKLPAKEPIVEESKQEEVPQVEATQEAAVHLGNKIRQALEQAKKQPKETPVPVVPVEEEPPDENKPVQALAQKIKDAIEKAKNRALEQPTVSTQPAAPQEEQEDNQIAGYIEELEKIKDTGTVEQQEEATTSLKELKKYIDKTVQDCARRILDLGGGGGSVAVQYAKGGTMDGNLSVNNLYPNNNNGEIGSPSNRWDRIYANQIDSLSSNIVVELSGFYVNGDFTVNGTISAIGGNSNQWNSTYNTMQASSAGWESVESTVYANSAKWESNYTTTNTYSGLWQSVYTTVSAFSASWEESADITALQNSLTNVAVTSGNWNSNYTTTNNNSASWSSVYTTTNNNSAYWQTTYATVTALSANWNTGYNNTIYNVYGTTDQIVVTSAGSNTGNNSVTLSLPSNLIVPNNLTVQGNLTALGTSTFKNTIFTTTSALSVINTGPGPALYVFQTAGPYDVASFYDGDGVEVLHVGNAQGGGNPLGKVGVNTSDPTVEFTVNGQISANNIITVAGGNSNQWNSNYTTTNNNSAGWNSNYTTTNNNSAGWNSNYTTTNNNSAGWSSVYTTTNNNSAGWNSNYTTTNTNSALWQSVYTTVSAFSANWTGVTQIIAGTNITVSPMGGTGVVTINSTGGGASLGDIPTLSANWNSTYTTTNTFSSSWTDYGSTVPIASNSVTLELSAFSYFLVYLNANITTLTFRNPKTAPLITSFVLQLSADGTARTVTWPVSIRWPGGSAPSITSTANKVDTFTFFSYDSGLSYYGFATGTSS